MKKFLFALVFFLFLSSKAEAQIQLATGTVTTPIPFVGIDSSDHVSEKTGVTISCGRIKNGTAGACAGSVTEIANGDYKYTLGAGDVDTAGVVTFRFSGTGMDVARAMIQVGGVPIAGGAVSVASGGITSASFAAGAITSAAMGARGTAQTVTSVSLKLAASEAWGTNALANKYGLYIVTASGGNAGVYTCITANTSAAGANVVTVAWPNSLAPSGTITYDLIPDAGCDNSVVGTVTGSVGSIGDAVRH